MTSIADLVANLANIGLNISESNLTNRLDLIAIAADLQGTMATITDLENRLTDIGFDISEVDLINNLNLIAIAAKLSAANSSQSSTQFVPLVIYQGESNSGGYALLSDLTSAQLLARPAVQILNNNSLVFEPLQIGVNNLINHSLLPDNNTVGWEDGLATAVESGLFSPFNQVYLVKTGQGGSTVAEWAVGGSYLNAYIARVQAAKNLILATGKIPLPFIWHSLGINDRVAGTNPTTWKADVIAMFKNIRKYIGYAPIIEPLFMAGGNDAFNPYLADIQSTEKYFFTVPSTGATLRDPGHWDAPGMALLASRMVDTTINLIGIGVENYTLTSLLALGGSAPTTRVTQFLAAPVITSQPTNQSVSQGENASFSVTATGSPTPTYQWQKQESGTGAFTNISGATSSSYATGTLTVAADNTDVYRVVITNSQGSVTSNPAVLTVSVGLAAVNWVALSPGVTNGVPSTGYIAANLTNVGGRSDRAIDATQPFSFIYDYEYTEDNFGIVVYLDDTTSTDYTFSSANDYIIGSYVFGGNLATTIQGGTVLESNIFALGSPTRIKIEKSGNDVLLSTSMDEGVTWTLLRTLAGYLAGKTTIYLKALFAVTGNQRLKVSQS